MHKLKLTIACGDYDRTQALRDGSVEPEGLDLNYVRINPTEGLWRQLQFGEFDASEMSMSALIMLIAGGDHRFVGIPAFTSRAFRHGCIFIHRRSAIRRPEDLAGRRIGVPEYHMTAALWIRGFLQDDHGVTPESIHWFQGGLDKPGYRARLDFDLPETFKLTSVQDKSLGEMLATGEIDALIGSEAPLRFRQGDRKIQRLYPRYRSIESAYYKRTAYFPIMHCVAIRREVYEANPWIAMQLYSAFVEARDRALRVLGVVDTLRYMLPWLGDSYSKTVELMGEDYWRYGVDASRHELRAMCRYSNEQGLASRIVAEEELFAPETLRPFPMGGGAVANA